MTDRARTIERRTGETEVRLSLGLEGTGAGARDTGVGFFDHMLDLLARHGRMDLDVSVSGDLQTGGHHTAEDTAIVLGTPRSVGSIATAWRSARAKALKAASSMWWAFVPASTRR